MYVIGDIVIVVVGIKCVDVMEIEVSVCRRNATTTTHGGIIYIIIRIIKIGNIRGLIN